MQSDLHFLDLPIKHAIIAALVFAGTYLLLGYAYQFLALVAVGAANKFAAWEEMMELSGFTVDRTVRYLIFYFLTFTSLTCFSRSAIKDAPFGPLFLLVAVPSVMSFVPYLFTGSFQASSYWGLTAMLIAQMYFGSGPRSGMARAFFVFLVLYILASDEMVRLEGWTEEFQIFATSVHGESAALGMTNTSLFYFAAVTVVSMGVNFYLIYMIPRNFIRELQKSSAQPTPAEATEKPAAPTKGK